MPLAPSAGPAEDPSAALAIAHLNVIEILHILDSETIETSRSYWQLGIAAATSQDLQSTLDIGAHNRDISCKLANSDEEVAE